MSRRVSTLAAVLFAASMLAACGSGAATTAPASQVPTSHPARSEPAARPSPASSSRLRATAQPRPSLLATRSPAPSPSQEETFVLVPQPSLAPFAADAPATPTEAQLDYLSTPCKSANPDETCEPLQAAWHENNPSGVTIRVYAVTACLHSPTVEMPNEHCVVDGDVLPTASLVLVGTAPASSGSLSFTLAAGAPGPIGWLLGGGPSIFAIVLQAVDEHGGSAFAIADSSAGCYGCWQ